MVESRPRGGRQVKCFKWGRLAIALEFTRDGCFQITQQSGFEYSFPFAVGWLTEPPGNVPIGKSPFKAFTCQIGPIAFTAGIL